MAYFQQLQGYMDDMNSAQSHEQDVVQGQVDKKVSTIQEKFEAVSQQAEGWGGALVGAGQAWKLGRKVYKSIKATNETSGSAGSSGATGTSAGAGAGEGTAGTGEIPLSGGYSKVASKAKVEGQMATDDTIPLDNSSSLISRGAGAIKSAVGDVDGSATSSGAGATSDALNIAKPLLDETGVQQDLVSRVAASARQAGGDGGGSTNVIGDMLNSARSALQSSSAGAISTSGAGAGVSQLNDLTSNVASRASSAMSNISDFKGALGRGMSAVRNGVSRVAGQAGAGGGAGAGEELGASVGKSILERVGASSFADAVPVLGEAIGIGSLIGGLVHGLHKKAEDSKIAGASAVSGTLARGAIDTGTISSNLGSSGGGYVA